MAEKKEYIRQDSTASIYLIFSLRADTTIHILSPSRSIEPILIAKQRRISHITSLSSISFTETSSPIKELITAITEILINKAVVIFIIILRSIDYYYNI